MFQLLIVSVCNAGYFGFQDLCQICPENTIKSVPGNAYNCLDHDPPCDGYNSGANCIKCTDNSIESAPYYETDCSAAQPCDITTSVPKAGHTACGK